MKIERLLLREIHLPLVHFFETSFGRTSLRRVILVQIESGGITGWGECVAGEGPFYSYETVDTVWEVLTRYLVPRLLQRPLNTVAELPDRLLPIRGHRMAKASLESALWDWEARFREVPLWRLLGGTRERIPCGVSIGIQESVDDLLRNIEKELKCGYRKIKIKIKPGWDVDVVRTVRRHFPDVSLMVDANSAYRPAHAGHLQELDAFGLLMIEQPLFHDDICSHAALQAVLQTPLCLDESIRHARDAAWALELEACRIINIKMGRVGGFSEARKIHDLCLERGVPVWCGGMLETGIGRAHNIALSTLENFSIPGDVSASKRYFERDTVVPPVEVDADGRIEAPGGPGIGFEPDLEWIDAVTVRSRHFEDG